jgi:hypothetical protein
MDGFTLIDKKILYMIRLANKIKLCGLAGMAAIIFYYPVIKMWSNLQSRYRSPNGGTLGETIAATPTDSLYYRLIVQSGMLGILNDSAVNYTMFVPEQQWDENFH